MEKVVPLYEISNMQVKYQILKYVGMACMLSASAMMMSPTLASKSILPWIAYLMGNTIWAIDSLKAKDKPWVVASIVFCIINIISLVERL